MQASRYQLHGVREDHGQCQQSPRIVNDGVAETEIVEDVPFGLGLEVHETSDGQPHRPEHRNQDGRMGLMFHRLCVLFLNDLNTMKEL